MNHAMNNKVTHSFILVPFHCYCCWAAAELNPFLMYLYQSSQSMSVVTLFGGPAGHYSEQSGLDFRVEIDSWR